MQVRGSWLGGGGIGGEKGDLRKQGDVRKQSDFLFFLISFFRKKKSPLSVGFSRQECWSGLPFPSPGALPDPGMELWKENPASPALPTDSSPSEPRNYQTLSRRALWTPPRGESLSQSTFRQPPSGGGETVRGAGRGKDRGLRTARKENPT